MTNDIRIPTMLLSEAICRRNIAAMVAHAQGHDIRLRPHFKTHQSRLIGRWFRELGIDSITVSSVAMANYFADDGWTDITIAFPINLREIDDLEALASRVKLGLLVESPRVIVPLQERLGEVDIWLKIDTGYGRTGIAWDNTALLEECARAVAATATLRLRGILTHAGDTYHAAGPDEIRERFDRSRTRMHSSLRTLQPCAADLLCSVGDTPGCSLGRDFAGIDEIRPGNFVFHDVMQYRLGVCRTEDI
ncbi:MAG: alanine racemase, partial [Bacteroidetes bacterium]|nr:alanine racemase [Bacteroidota bacterium]